MYQEIILVCSRSQCSKDPKHVDAKNLPRFATVPTAPAKMDSPKVSGTVPKMKVLNLIRPFCGWGFPYISLTYSKNGWLINKPFLLGKFNWRGGRRCEFFEFQNVGPCFFLLHLFAQ